MEHTEFHVSVVMAVILREVGLSQEGLPAFCDLLKFMTGDESDDIWNSEDIRIVCRNDLLQQNPGLDRVRSHPVQKPGIERWWQWLEDRFGPHVLVSNIQNGTNDSGNN